MVFLFHVLRGRTANVAKKFKENNCGCSDCIPISHSFLPLGLPYYKQEMWYPKIEIKEDNLPGWKCQECGAFNGDAKEFLLCCRACNALRYHHLLLNT